MSNQGDRSQEFLASFAGQAAETADRYALERAVALLAGGAAPEMVRRQTGWHQWVDGKWRFEISDADARLKNLRMDASGVAMRATSLGELLTHGALYAAYPDIANLDVQITIDPQKHLLARFLEPTKGDGQTLGNSAQIDVTAPTAEDALSALLHEVQHYIQMREGFAPGGAMRSADVDLPEDVVNEIHRLHEIAMEHSLKGEFDKAREKREEGSKLRRQEAFQMYLKLAGEVEARNTEARRQLTDEERKAVAPSVTADFPDADVVVSSRAGVSAKVGETLNALAPQFDMFGDDFARKSDEIQTDIVISSRGDRMMGVNEDQAGRQIAQTHQGLDNFWRWFGDSAASDNGRPLLLFHSTNADFSQFRTGIPTINSTNFGDVRTERHAIFATPDANLSHTYLRPGDGQNVMPVYMSIKSPLDLTRGLDGPDARMIVEASGGTVSYAEITGIEPHDAWMLFDGDLGRRFVQAARSADFDGAVLLEADGGGSTISYAVFDPAQVKSAMGNRERFDPQSPDILQSAMPDALARWAGATRTINQDGSLKVFYHGTSQDFSAFSNESQAKGSMGSSVGFYFAESAAAASHYGDSSEGGRVMPVYLKMETPMVFDSKQINREDLSQLLGVDLGEVYGAPERAEVYWYFKNGGAYDGRDSARVGDAVVAAAKAKGYDGVIFKEAVNGQVVDVHLVFDAHQIKSAIGNRGRYSTQSEDILHSVDLDAVSVSFNGVVAPLAPVPANIRRAPAVDDVQRVRAGVASVLGAQAAERVLGGKDGSQNAGLLVVRSTDLAAPSKSAPQASPMSFVLAGQWLPAGASTLLSAVAPKESPVSYLQMLRDAQPQPLQEEGDAIVFRKGSDPQWRAIEFNRSAGMWSMRPFDAGGPGAPRPCASLDEALALCSADGYSVRDDSAWERMSGSKTFQRQALRESLERKVDSGEVSQDRARETLDAYDRTQMALAAAAASSAQAYYHPQADTIVLVADRIAPGDEAAVYLHEVIHRSGRASIGPSGWNRLVGRIKGWERRDEGAVELEIYRRAYARAKAAVGEGHRHYDEELFAYSVEEAVRIGVKPSLAAPEDSAEAWLADVVATLEGVIYQTTQSVQALDAQQLVNLAYALAQLESPERAQQVRQALARSRAQRDAAMAAQQQLAQPAAAPVSTEWRLYEGLQKAVQALPVLEADAGAWHAHLSGLVLEGGINQDDLFWSGLQDWLELQSGDLPKDALIGFLRGNAMRIQEVSGQESPLRAAPAPGGFDRWFGASKVVDAQGAPMVMYHGTDANFDVFQPSADGVYGPGVYLTKYDGDAATYGRNVMPVYVSLQNPYAATPGEARRARKDGGTQAWSKAIQDQGYDGILVQDLSVVVAFRPEQIKSAIRNNGDFDPASPDIRLSRQVGSAEDQIHAALQEMLAAEKALEQLRSGDVSEVTLDQWMALSDRSLSAKKALTAEIAKRPDDGFALQAQASGARMVTLTQSAQQPGKWQLTRFDAQGAPWGDTNFASKDHAIREFIDEADLSTLVDADGASLGRKAGQYQGENFKRWFEGSKVVDAEGQPLRVYHGTGRDFSAFDKGAQSVHIPLPGFYFTPSTGVASGFAESAAKLGEDKAGRAFEPIGANVMPVYLSIKNPAEIDARSSSHGGKMPSEGAIKAMLLQAQKSGHDGAIIRGWTDGSGPVQYVAFRPEQIKSATGNSGEYNKENPDIRHSIKDEAAPPEAKDAQSALYRWFGEPGKDSSLVNEDGSPMRLYHGTNVRFNVFRRSKTGAMGPGIYLGDERSVAEAYDGNGQGSQSIMEVYARGKYLNNLQWTDYVNKNGWGGAEAAARADGWSGVRDTMFESAVVVWDAHDIKSATDNSGQFDPATSDIRYSHPGIGPLGYYSALSRAIEGLNSGAAPAGGWKDTIKGLVNKGLVKQDEVKWSGLSDWLELQQGRVTKDQVLEYIRGNGVQLGEVVLQEGDWAVYDGEENQYFGSRAEALAYANEVDINVTQDTVFRATNRSGGYGAKYGEYTLPGGENYREVLLTLPIKQGEPARHLVKDQSGKTLNSFDTYKKAEDFVSRNNVFISGLSIEPAGNKEMDGAYKSGHWAQPNVLVHIRLNDRVAADGKRVLFVEEIQSDWGADGKRKGFRGQKGEPLSAQDHARALVLQNKERNTGEPLTADERVEFDALMARHTRAHDGLMVPAAPFVTKTDSWLNLALKRVVMMAVDEGYDKVAFVTGEQSADRYDLSKKVGVISSEANLDGTYDITMIMHSGESQHLRGKTKQEVEDAIGKAMAAKAIAAADAWLDANKACRNAIRQDGVPEAELNRLRAVRDGVETVFFGLDLKVGGEGMTTFYDSIVFNAVKALVKRLGGQIEGVALSKESFETDQAAADDALLDELGVKIEGRRPATQPGFAITPVMREMLTVQGVPLFSHAFVDKAQGEPRKAYHYSPSANRESIAKNGLTAQSDRTGMNAVFLSDTCKLQPGMDVYEVDAQGLQLSEDSTTDAPDGERWYAVFGDIDAQKIRPVLLDKDKPPRDSSREDGCDTDDVQWPRVRYC